MSTEEAATDATDAALMTSIAEMGRGAAAEAAIDAGVTSAAAEAAGDDAAPERVLAAPSPGDFLASEVLSCLLYDGALVTKAHVRAATRLAATSKAWKAVDDAWRATLRAEIEQGGWGPFLADARFRVAFWNANVEDAKESVEKIQDLRMLPESCLIFDQGGAQKPGRKSTLRQPAVEVDCFRLHPRPLRA